MVTKVKSPFNGDKLDNTITGDNLNNVINARGGNDSVDGGGGNDFISAGAGKDFVLGGDGNDIILGGGGNDTINGGNGDDLIFGEAGQDILTGGAGKDVFVFNPANTDSTLTKFDTITDFNPLEDILSMGIDITDIGFVEFGGDLNVLSFKTTASGGEKIVINKESGLLPEKGCAYFYGNSDVLLVSTTDDYSCDIAIKLTGLSDLLTANPALTADFPIA